MKSSLEWLHIVLQLRGSVWLYLMFNYTQLDYRNIDRVVKWSMQKFQI